MWGFVRCAGLEQYRAWKCYRCAGRWLRHAPGLERLTARGGRVLPARPGRNDGRTQRLNGRRHRESWRHHRECRRSSACDGPQRSAASVRTRSRPSGARVRHPQSTHGRHVPIVYAHVLCSHDDNSIDVQRTQKYDFQKGKNASEVHRGRQLCTDLAAQKESKCTPSTRVQRCAHCVQLLAARLLAAFTQSQRALKKLLFGHHFKTLVNALEPSQDPVRVVHIRIRELSQNQKSIEYTYGKSKCALQ